MMLLSQQYLIFCEFFIVCFTFYCCDSFAVDDVDLSGGNKQIGTQMTKTIIVVFFGRVIIIMI